MPPKRFNSSGADTTAPELSIPADYTVECSDDIVYDEASATDNCGLVNLDEVMETMAGDCTGNYTITRAFTATDECGNSTTLTQAITVEDTTAPEFTSVPADYTVECSDEMPMEDAMAMDNCGTTAITVVAETTAGNCTGNYTITHLHGSRRLWKQQPSGPDHHGARHHPQH